MAVSELVSRTRQALGPMGAFVGLAPDGASVDEQRTGVVRLESAGWRAVWTNEIVGTDALLRASLWLAATERLVVGTCIANVWARPAQTAHAAATQLTQAFADRFVLGLGVGRPEQARAVGQEFGPPAATARDYLGELSTATYPRLLAANGPKLLTLAAELADGALPAGRPPTDTALARDSIGPDKLLAVYVPLTPDAEAGVVSRTVREHLDAGADHVIVGRSYDADFGAAVSLLEALGPQIA